MGPSCRASSALQRVVERKFIAAPPCIRPLGPMKSHNAAGLRCIYAPARPPGFNKDAIHNPDVTILRERCPRNATLLEAVCEVGGVDEGAARDLLLLGAVYVGDDVTGQANKVRWRRSTMLLRDAHLAAASNPTATAAAAATAAATANADVSTAGSSSIGDSGSGSCSIFSGGAFASGTVDRSDAAAVGAMAALPVQGGQWVRVHPFPRRFPACDVDWSSRVLHLDAGLCVINKPGGLPCQPHESNGRECVAPCVARGLRRAGVLSNDDDDALHPEGLSSDEGGGENDAPPGHLWLVHRLDLWTTGVMVLGRNADAARNFMVDLSAGGRVCKTYKALTLAPPDIPTGPGAPTLVHEMFDGPFGTSVAVMRGGGLRSRGPRLLRDIAAAAANDGGDGGVEGGGKGGGSGDAASPRRGKGWKRCELALECVREVSAESARGAGLPVPSGVDVVYESTVRLLTGRTHQIRAQLAAVGAPLLGDVMYTPMAGVVMQPGEEIASDEVIGAVEASVQVDAPVGLHAASLSWRGREWSAPAPWEE